MRTFSPTRACAPFCIFLLTSRICPWPVGSGKSEVRKAKPSISPLTLLPRRVGQASATLKGTRAITHLRAVPSGSSRAVKDFLGDLGIGVGTFPVCRSLIDELRQFPSG